MLIYRLLGDDAQQSFARSWGISYGMNAATEWKDIVVEALKAAVILAVLERLCFTRNSSWLEVRRGAVCVQRSGACARGAFVRHRCMIRCFVRTTQEHIDYISLQALLFREASLTLVQQTRLFFSHTKRLSS
jgi:hypothetical protein